MERWRLKCGATGVLETVAPSGRWILFMLRQERCMTGSYFPVSFRHRAKSSTWTIVKKTDSLSLFPHLWNENDQRNYWATKKFNGERKIFSTNKTEKLDINMGEKNFDFYFTTYTKLHHRKYKTLKLIEENRRISSCKVNHLPVLWPNNAIPRYLPKNMKTSRLVHTSVYGNSIISWTANNPSVLQCENR